MKKSTLPFFLALALSLLASTGDDDKFRTQIRFQAESAGVALSNVWTRVQSDRMMVIFGGALDSTQDLHTLFCSITNFNNFIRQVQQSIQTPDGNPYPEFFSVGFDPYALAANSSNKTEKIINDSKENTTNKFENDPKAIFTTEDEMQEGGG